MILWYIVWIVNHIICGICGIFGMSYMIMFYFHPSAVAEKKKEKKWRWFKFEPRLWLVYFCAWNVLLLLLQIVVVAMTTHLFWLKKPQTNQITLLCSPVTCGQHIVIVAMTTLSFDLINQTNQSNQTFVLTCVLATATFWHNK